MCVCVCVCVFVCVCVYTTCLAALCRTFETSGLTFLSQASVAMFLGLFGGFVVRHTLGVGKYAEWIGFKEDFFFLFLLPPIIFESGTKIPVASLPFSAHNMTTMMSVVLVMVFSLTYSCTYMSGALWMCACVCACVCACFVLASMKWFLPSSVHSIYRYHDVMHTRLHTQQNALLQELWLNLRLCILWHARVNGTGRWHHVRMLVNGDTCARNAVP